MFCLVFFTEGASPFFRDVAPCLQHRQFCFQPPLSPPFFMVGERSFPAFFSFASPLSIRPFRDSVLGQLQRGGRAGDRTPASKTFVTPTLKLFPSLGHHPPSPDFIHFPPWSSFPVRLCLNSASEMPSSDAVPFFHCLPFLLQFSSSLEPFTQFWTAMF